MMVRKRVEEKARTKNMAVVTCNGGEEESMFGLTNRERVGDYLEGGFGDLLIATRTCHLMY